MNTKKNANDNFFICYFPSIVFFCIWTTDGSQCHKFTLPPGSIYIMKGKSRYDYFHDVTRIDGSHPFAIVMRFGKFNLRSS